MIRGEIRAAMISETTMAAGLVGNKSEKGDEELKGLLPEKEPAAPVP